MLKLPVGSKGHISKSSHIKKVLVNIFVFVHTFKKKKKIKTINAATNISFTVNMER